MESTFARAEELAGNIREYVNSRIESVKLTAAEKSSGIIANLIAGLVLAVFFLLFILFGSIALAFGLGEWIGKTWAGFLIVACLYLLVALVAWFARGRIIRIPLMNALIKQLFKNDDEEY